MTIRRAVLSLCCVRTLVCVYVLAYKERAFVPCVCVFFLCVRAILVLEQNPLFLAMLISIEG